MLLKSSAGMGLTRIQGSFLDDSEVERIATYVKSQDTPDFIKDDFLDEPAPAPSDDSYEDEEEIILGSNWKDEYEPELRKAWKFASIEGLVSASKLQRNLGMGFNKAGAIVDEMYRRGIVGPDKGSRPRDLLKKFEET